MKRLLILLLFFSCSRGCLFVENYYFTSKDLASMHVSTPDPALDCPSVGQRLIVRWNLPDLPKGAELVLHLRFRNREDEVQRFCLTRLRGKHVFELRDHEYISSQGILTYKAEIVSGDEVLHEWLHQVWAPRIEISNG